MPHKFRSLKFHQWLFLAGIVLVAVPLGYSIYLEGLYRAEIEEQGRQKIDRRLDSTVLAVNERINEVIATLTVLANSEEGIQGDWDGLYNLAHRVLQQQTNLNAITVVDPNGELVVGTPAKLGAPRKRAQLRDSALRAIETAKPVVSGPFRSPYVNEIDAQPIWVVAVNLPMTVKGEKTHVIRGIIRCAEFSDLLIGMKFPDRWIGLITDGNGTPIASSAQHGVTVGNTVGGKILDTDKNYQKINVGGIEYQSRKTLLDGPKWTVQVGIAADEDADASNVATLRITVFYCLMIVWMGSFGFFAARKIRRRLNLIVDLARDVSQRKIIKTSFSVIDEINEFQEALQKLSAEQQLLLEKSQKNESAPERRVV